MSQPWWQTRDPDMGRDRETKALGKRAWNWFTAYDGSALAPADIERAYPPWAQTTISARPSRPHPGHPAPRDHHVDSP